MSAAAEAPAAADTPRNFAEWSSHVVDIRLTYNGGRQISWLDAGLRLETSGCETSPPMVYSALMSLQSGGYGDILLALARPTIGLSRAGKSQQEQQQQQQFQLPSSIEESPAFEEDLRELSKSETESARDKFRGLEAQRLQQRQDVQQHLAVLKVPKKCLSRPARDKAFKKAMRALNELKCSEVPGVSLMLDYSQRHCIEVYRYYPCDLAAAAREIQNPRGAIGAGGAIPESFLFFWALQLAEAVTALHERGILHCDLHPENVLLDPDGNLVLHDFGLSKRLPELPPPYGRRRRNAWVRIPRKFREDARQFALLEAGWWPPELEEAFRARDGAAHMNHTVDWYGLGATLFRLRTGAYPLRHFSEVQLARMLERPMRLHQHLTPNFSHFLLQLLREKITDRLGHAGDGREVLSHVCIRSSPLFRNCDSWEQRREMIRARQLPQPYRIVWSWPESVQRMENCRFPRLA